MKTNVSPVYWVSFAMIVGLMGTALISPLYGLYQTQWSLQASEVSMIYVIYMLGALFSLLVLGRLPDRIGFHKMLLVSLGLTIVGTVLTIFAPNAGWLSFGRFIVGVAASIASTAGTVGLTALTPPDRRTNLSLVISLLISAGFGAGPLLGGVMGQFAPLPLVTSFLPSLVLAVIAVLAMLLAVPRGGQPSGGPLRLRELLPKLTTPDAGQRLAFFMLCGAPFLAFGVFGIYASMTPLLVAQMLHMTGPLISGLSVACILLVSGVVQVLVRKVPYRISLSAGLIAIALSSVALMVNLSANSVIVFVLGIVLTAAGHGMAMLASMTALTAMAKPTNRAELTSSYMVIGYCGAIIPVLGVGWMADHWGMDTAVFVSSAVVIVLSLIVMVANLLIGRRVK